MQESSQSGLPRIVMEMAVAILTGAFGAAVCIGSIEAGAGWSDMGPDAGYFPFFIGLLIIVGSLANVVQAVVRLRGSGEIFIETGRFKAVLGFFLPLLAFAFVSTFLGLSVATAFYIAGVMIVQGPYKWWVGLPVGIGVSLFFFIIFEIGFKVPLLKGPLEAWLGIY